MLHLLSERAYAFEFAITRGKRVLVLWHGVRRRHKVILQILNGTVQHLADTVRLRGFTGLGGSYTT